MPNETFLSVPLTVPQDIRRPLQLIIEQLDSLIGNRGANPALRINDLTTAQTSLNELNAQLQTLDTLAADLRAEIDEIVNEINNTLSITAAEVEELQNYWTSRTLDSTFYDFDDTAWDTLVGNFEFTTLGSNILNAPFAVVGTSTYTVYALCVNGQNGFDVIRLIVVKDGVNSFEYTKAGGSWL